MIEKQHYLIFGILSLSLSYIMFTGQQYFSIPAMLGLFALALLAMAFFLFPHIYPDRVHDRKILLALFALLAILALYEYLFDLIPPNALGPIGFDAFLVAISTAISILGIHYLGKAIQLKKEYGWYAYAILGALAIAFAAYAVMYIINTVQWNGVDEVAFNYYAAYLFVHGQNPYTTSMQPIVALHNIQPTVQLDGTYEFAYDYPAMSFLPFIILPLLGITNFLSFTYLTIFFAIFAALVLYRNSNLNRHLLIPIAVWLIASYALVGVASQYLAVPVFILLAYLYRARPVLFGVFMGLGASTIQLTWFAIPFLLVLIYKEKGMKFVARSAATALGVFALINAYFVLLDPVAIKNIFGLFGLTKLPFYGTNIMQFIVAFYSLPYWYSAFISILFFLVMLALFYFYTNTLKPLIAIVPIAIFFFSWRNITIYGLPFIPILLAIYYWSDRHKHRDMLKDRSYMIGALGAFVFIGLVVAVVAHGLYLNSHSLKIQNVFPIISVQSSSYYSAGTQFGLIGLKASVNNSFDSQQNLSFYIVSRSPYGEQYFLSQNLNKSAAHSLSNYTLNYPLQLIGQSTQIEVFVFSKDYISSRSINFSRLGKDFNLH
ncbi:MAG: hypothetical protein KGH53_03575 [Candidatus Micrarchaeota archaeon]|nr:hypothetical protein [Candidatus Micrarchaeota archaeon]